MSYIPRAANTGHVRPERFGDLHGERTHTSRRSVDQNLLPRAESVLYREGPAGADCRHRHGCRLLECEAGRFQRQLIFVSTHILSEGASAPSPG
jgi:hypothetical protein